MNDSTAPQIRLNPHMLYLARSAAGETQTSMSEKLGVSQGWLSKIEDGLIPTLDRGIVERLGKVTGFPASFFQQEGTRRPLREAFYRRKKAVPKGDIWRAEALINIRRLQIETLLRKSDVTAALQLPHLDVDEFAGGASEIARQVRYFWRVPGGPIENLIVWAERAGIVVCDFDFGIDDIDGISILCDGGTPLVLLNHKKPATRCRFTLAHEIGHLIMHSLPRPNMESEAHEFASEFLMPENDIRQYLFPLDLNRLAQLKLRWKVSMQAILMRAKSLGVMKDSYYKFMMMKLSQAGYRKVEPYDQDIPRERPALFERLIRVHKVDWGYSDEDLASMLHTTVESLRSLVADENSHSFRVVRLAE